LAKSQKKAAEQEQIQRRAIYKDSYSMQRLSKSCNKHRVLGQLIGIDETNAFQLQFFFLWAPQDWAVCRR